MVFSFLKKKQSADTPEPRTSKFLPDALELPELMPELPELMDTPDLGRLDHEVAADAPEAQPSVTLAPTFIPADSLTLQQDCLTAHNPSSWQQQDTRTLTELAVLEALPELEPVQALTPPPLELTTDPIASGLEQQAAALVDPVIAKHLHQIDLLLNDLIESGLYQAHTASNPKQAFRQTQVALDSQLAQLNHALVSGTLPKLPETSAYTAEKPLLGLSSRPAHSGQPFKHQQDLKQLFTALPNDTSTLHDEFHFPTDQLSDTMRNWQLLEQPSPKEDSSTALWSLTASTAAQQPDLPSDLTRDDLTLLFNHNKQADFAL